MSLSAQCENLRQTESHLLELICLQNKIFVNSAKFPEPLGTPFSSNCLMFTIISLKSADAKRSNRKLWKYSCLQQNRLLSPTEESVELKQGGGQTNDSSSEEADVITTECGLCKI